MMHATRESVLQVLESVLDPEIPALSVLDLGIVREVDVTSSPIRVVITPTYSGCPATAVIQNEIERALKNANIEPITVEIRLAPPWTTAWITERGRERLRESGIAPSIENITPSGKSSLQILPDVPACPFCASKNTRAQSEFGSTPCKALYFCDACHQPFEYFKRF